MRVGYLVVPPQLVDAMRAQRALSSGGVPWLEQTALAEFMQSGSFAVYLTRCRAQYKESRDALLASLRRHIGAVELGGEAAGLHVFWRLPAGVHEAGTLEALARGQHVGIYSLAPAGARELLPGRTAPPPRAPRAATPARLWRAASGGDSHRPRAPSGRRARRQGHDDPSPRDGAPRAQHLPLSHQRPEPAAPARATNVNPLTGERDMDIPAALRQRFGHKDLGIYLVARTGGRVLVGDAVQVPELASSAAPTPIPLPARAHGNFICRGCYYVYEQGQRGPTGPLGPFEDLGADWRCPDCGTTPTTSAPYLPVCVPDANDLLRCCDRPCGEAECERCSSGGVCRSVDVNSDGMEPATPSTVILEVTTPPMATATGCPMPSWAATAPVARRVRVSARSGLPAVRDHRSKGKSKRLRAIGTSRSDVIRLCEVLRDLLHRARAMLALPRRRSRLGNERNDVGDVGAST